MSNSKVYVVLGMPRSGTSTITKALQALGIYLGDQLIPAKSTWNAKGYFEDKEIVHDINRKILNTLFDNWESIQLLDPKQFDDSALIPIRNHAIDLIKQRYHDYPNWGFKDPRTVRVLPFWQNIFTELQLDDRYIIALRNPLASAHSFMKLTKIDLEKGLLLWLAHLIPALNETQGKKRLVVSYDLLMQNPEKQLTRIKNYFQLENVRDADTEKYQQDFLDIALTHYHFSEEDFKNHPLTSLIPAGLNLYELLMKLAKDEVSFDQLTYQEAWSEIQFELKQYTALYSYIDMLLKRNKYQERQLRMIDKSFSWKMIYPVRLIDNKLRHLRKSLFNK